MLSTPISQPRHALRIGPLTIALLAGLSVGLPAHTAAAQCTSAWSTQFALAGVRANFADAAVWNDGTGPALYLVGYTGPEHVGNIDNYLVSPTATSGAVNVARWDGVRWSTVGPAVVNVTDPLAAMQYLNAVVAFDLDGPGPQTERLIVGGVRNSGSQSPVLQFNGTAWSTLGAGFLPGDEVFDLIVFNGALYACGNFRSGATENFVRWDIPTQRWVAAGGGIPSSQSPVIRADRMAVCDADGDGTQELYVGGSFAVAGSPAVLANGLARFNGSTFSAVPGYTGTFGSSGTPLPPSVLKGVVMSDGPSLLVGNALYTGIVEPRAALARLHAGVWSTLLADPRNPDNPADLGVVADAAMFGAPGPVGNTTLHISGSRLLDGIGSQTRTSLARLGPSGWEAIAPPGPGTPADAAGAAARLFPVDWDFAGPAGEKLLISAHPPFVIGGLGYLGSLRPLDLTLWNGAAIEPPIPAGADDLALSARLIRELDPDGPGPQPRRLYLWADLGIPNATPIDNDPNLQFMTFDGSGYTPVPGITPPIFDLTTFATPTHGTRLVVAARADLTPGSNTGMVSALTNAGWETIGTTGTAESVTTLARFRIGAQDQLLATGNMTSIGGVPCRWAARWDGAAWHPFDDGLPDPAADPNLSATGGIVAAAVFNNQPFAFIFYSALDLSTGTTSFVSQIYRHTGAAWEPAPGAAPGNPLSNPFVSALRVLDLGSGPRLIAAGNFTDLGGAPGTSGIAQWDGAAWSPVGAGLTFDEPGGFSARVSAVAAHDFGTGPQLVAALAGPATSNGTPLQGLVRFDGINWVQIPGAERILDVATLEASAIPGAAGLYAGGNFTNAGGVESYNIARLITTCCRADFNGVGGVTVQDLFDFLTAWFAGAPSADINNTAGITVQDLFDFLSLWFAGCP